MTILLKQSTAVVISFGPFVLFSDGVTLVTNLVGTGANQTENTTSGIRISKNGGAFAARHATATASTYDAYGNYLVTLDATDTGTLGVLRVQFQNAAAFCPVWQDFMIVAANIYDSLIGGGDVLDVSVTQLLGTAWLTPGTAGTPDVNAKLIGGTAQSAGDIIGDTNDIQTRLPAALTADGNMKADTLRVSGTLQAARDLGGTLGVAGAGLTALGDARIANLDATVSSRLAGASYTAPDNADIVTILARTDVATSTRLATAGYTAPDNADIVAIKAKTDNLPVSPAATGAQMDLVNAPNATALLAISAAIAALSKDGYTWTEIMGIMGAAMAGKVSGGPGSSVFRSLDDTANRISATADSDGNRSVVTLNP